jgi:hypothetical protein
MTDEPKGAVTFARSEALTKAATLARQYKEKCEAEEATP